MNGAAAGSAPRDWADEGAAQAGSASSAPSTGGLGDTHGVARPGEVIAPAGHPAAAGPGRAQRPTSWQRRAALDEQLTADAARVAAERNSRRAGGLLRKARSVAFGGGATPAGALHNAFTHRRSSGPAKRRRVGVGRMLCWQLAVVAVIASLGAPKSIMITTIAAATATVLATTIRFRGRLLYEWLIRAWHFSMRPHRAQLNVSGAGQDLVDLLGDHASVETIDIDGIPVAFIHQADGVSAVLELHTSQEASDPAWSSLLSVSSLLPIPDAAAPPFGAQLILQTTPPGELGGLQADGGSPTRRAWITVQALRSADIHDSRDLTQALSNAVQRMMRRLARDDVPTRTLDRDETMSLVLALAQLDTAESSTPLQVEETWTAWETGAGLQACFRVLGWRDADDAARQQALRRLELIPSKGTTVAIAARRRDRRAETEADCDVTVRITERDRSRLENSASLLAFALEDVPVVRPERMDGDHLAALAASLPLGAKGALR